MTDVLTIPRFAGGRPTRRPAVRRASRGLERRGRPPARGDRPMHVRRRRRVCDPARTRARSRDRREVRRSQRDGAVRPGRRADARPHADERGHRRPGPAPGARQGGSLLRNLDRATEPHGLATTAGNVSHSGRRGADAGGGHGLARPPVRSRVGQHRDVHARHRGRPGVRAPPTSTRTCSGVSEAVAATSVS